MLVSVSTTGFARPSTFIIADMELLGISGVVSLLAGSVGFLAFSSLGYVYMCIYI